MYRTEKMYKEKEYIIYKTKGVNLRKRGSN